MLFRAFISLIAFLDILKRGSSFVVQPATHRATHCEHRPLSELRATQSPDNENDKVFCLGVGFLQFLVVQQLSLKGLKTVAMTDVQRVESMREVWVTSPLCTLVTNGETEWEEEAGKCTSMVICPEVANIPGKTVRALLNRMPNVNRIVVLNPPGTTKPEEEKKEENFFSSLFKPKGPSATDDFMEYAKSVEEAVSDCVKNGEIDEAVIVHRGKLNGGGGEFGLGDNFYKVCGSEPEEVLQKYYDQGRLGTTILPGDSMDTSPKMKKRVAKEGEDEEEIAKLNVLEEIRDKTHRLSLANAVVSVLTMDDPPERFTVVCTLDDVPMPLDEVTDNIKAVMS
mmetsp:Transcript_32695/g.46467  ORF Transcript_32695/g.46467 Transcript_32695/m.46467 type:complete len:339 (+) Transcript_32695:45-1061(+)